MKRLTSPAPLAALGNNKGNSTVFLPAGPGGVNDIQGQVCLMHTRGANSLGKTSLLPSAYVCEEVLQSCLACPTPQHRALLCHCAHVLM